jgi:hypothetical protein
MESKPGSPMPSAHDRHGGEGRDSAQVAAHLARSSRTASGTTPCQSTGVQACDATHSLPHASQAKSSSFPSRTPLEDHEH